MKINIATFFFLAITSIFFFGCEKDVKIPPVLPEDPRGQIEIRFTPTMNNQPLEMNEIFQGPNNQRVLLETFKFYLSNIQLISQGDTLGSSDVELLDFSLNSKSIYLTSYPGTIDKVLFDVGLNPFLNGTNDENFNPAAYENSHPLSIYNSMYWSWASGYIFMKIEGRIDTSLTQNANPNYTYFYHCGLDTLKRSYSISNMNVDVAKGATSTIELTVEFNDVFRTPSDTINMQENYFTHTSDDLDLARSVIVNFGTAIRKL
ncbi:MAG: MbnP family protein [Bacteroidia bacterium]